MKVYAIWILGLLHLSGTATAANSGLYFDVALGQSKSSDVNKSDFDAVANSIFGPINTAELDDSGSFWSVAVGYRISRYIAVDLGWADLGDVKYRATGSLSGVPLLYKASVSSRGPTLAAMGILPIGKKLEVQARGGVMHAKTAVREYLADDTTNASIAYDAKTNELFLGIGAAFNFTETFAAHATVYRFNKVGDKSVTGESDVDVLSLGLTFRQ